MIRCTPTCCATVYVYRKFISQFNFRKDFRLIKLKTVSACFLVRSFHHHPVGTRDRRLLFRNHLQRRRKCLRKTIIGGSFINNPYLGERRSTKFPQINDSRIQIECEGEWRSDVDVESANGAVGMLRCQQLQRFWDIVILVVEQGLENHSRILLRTLRQDIAEARG